MKSTIYLLAVVTILLISTPALAQDGLGVGAIINEPNGISLRTSVTDDFSVNVATSFTISDNFSSLYLHGDFVFERPASDLNLESGALIPYYGGGLRLIFREDTENTVGFRIPLGLRYAFEDQPIDIFTELVPIIDVDPDFLFTFGGGLGFRYYFN